MLEYILISMIYICIMICVFVHFSFCGETKGRHVILAVLWPVYMAYTILQMAALVLILAASGFFCLMFDVYRSLKKGF